MQYSAVGDIARWKPGLIEDAPAQGNLFGKITTGVNTENIIAEVMTNNLQKATKIQNGFMNDGYSNLTSALHDIK